jgi:hypothetical protein
VSDGAATPHCAAFVFLLLPLTSLLWTGALNGFGMVIPEVSEMADTSIAEGGAIVYNRMLELECRSLLPTLEPNIDGRLWCRLLALVIGEAILVPMVVSA